MESGKDYLNVDIPSTSLTAIRDDIDVASTCPLLTPSPPTNALANPTVDELQQQSSPIIDGSELAEKLKKVELGDSSSSNSSVAEPASIELLHNYLTLTKSAADGIALQENGTRTTNLDVPYERKVENMCFFKWNWPIIRKFFVWGSLSSILAAVVLVVAMVATLPNRCNPPVKWYQGNLLYEIFPASFQDSNGDDIGDIKGLAQRADYIKSLGVRGIRLNSIFPATHYPENFQNITTLFDIQYQLGTMADFQKMIEVFHKKKIHVILDLPIWPLITDYHGSTKKLETTTDFSDSTRDSNNSNTNDEVDLGESETTITKALKFWLQKGVDGFYLKGLEKFVHDPYFAISIREWKSILGPDRILIVSYDVFKLASSYMHPILLNRIDLVDIKLDFKDGAAGVKQQLDAVQQGVLWSQPSSPWVHWSTGNVDSHRLSSTLSTPNATLGALLIQLMLPGTPSIFYGDEIALGEVEDMNGDRSDLQHLHQLTTMLWDKTGSVDLHENHILASATNARHRSLPWLPGKPEYVNFHLKKLLTKMIEVRMSNPAIYLKGIWKDSMMNANAAAYNADNQILVIERWYPRRNSFVVVSNLGNHTKTVDLSSLYYSGTAMVATNLDMENKQINFSFIRLRSGDSIVLKLDK